MAEDDKEDENTFYVVKISYSIHLYYLLLCKYCFQVYHSTLFLKFCKGEMDDKYQYPKMFKEKLVIYIYNSEKKNKKSFIKSIDAFCYLMYYKYCLR